MPCHVSATSVSSRRRALYQKRPPTIAAKLDLSKPGEAWAEDYLRRASTGKEAFWRPLAIRRDDAALLVAVQWLHWQPAKDRYSVVTLSLSQSERCHGASTQAPKRQRWRWQPWSPTSQAVRPIQHRHRRSEGQQQRRHR